MLLGCLFDHLEKRIRLCIPVNDIGAAENLVAAMLRIDLREAEHLRIGQLASDLFRKLLKVANLLLAQSQPLLHRVGAKVVNMAHRLRHGINTENLVGGIKVYLLQHRVILPARLFFRLFFRSRFHTLQHFNPRDAGNTHLGGDIHRIGAPRGYHLLARSDMDAGQRVAGEPLRTGKEPCEPLYLLV